MSSAERWRAVVLLSRISRIFNRGSVTFRPAFRRSLPSTVFSIVQPPAARLRRVRDQVLCAARSPADHARPESSRCGAAAVGDPESDRLLVWTIGHSATIEAKSVVNRSIFRTLALGLVAAATLLCGCVYRMDIQQGNYLEGRTVDQLL